MSKTITYRFKKCHDALIERCLVKNSSQLASELNVHRQFLSRVVNGLSEVTLDMVETLMNLYPISADYLLRGSGEMFQRLETDITKVVYVPAKAHAGYLEQNQEIVFLDSLSTFSLPSALFTDDDYRCFEVSGDSMEPSFYENELVLCSTVSLRYLDRIIKNDNFYIIITTDDILLKRIDPKGLANKELTLISDNSFYQTINMPVKDAVEIWKVEAKITTRLTNEATKSQTNPNYFSQFLRNSAII
jgi:phage repressor protein C with HTH and peptisase S24 domain